MRYLKNMKLLTEDENLKLRIYKVLIVGCGGLGGYIIEMLARLGFGHLVVVDDDVFDETNLNRQLLSKESLIGISKSRAAFDRVGEINSDVRVTYINKKVTRENVSDLAEGCHIIFDAVDNTITKLMLQEEAEKLNLPLIHGAIGGWVGQVSVVLPGDRTLSRVYHGKQNTIERSLGNPSFTPALVASIQVSEALKLLLCKGEILSKKILYIDLLSHDYEVIDFN